MLTRLITLLLFFISTTIAAQNVEIISNPISESLAVKVSNVKFNGEVNKFIYYHKGSYYFHQKTKEIFYFERLNKEEMLSYIQKFKAKNFYEIVINNIVEKAYAEDCNYSFVNTNLKNSNLIQTKIQDSFNQISFSSMLKSCDYSISNIVKKQYEKYAVNFSFNFDLSFFDSFSNIHKEIQKFIKTFSSEIMPLLVSMSSELPSFINHLFCGFTENKIGDFVIVGMTGGLGSALKIAETTSELLKIMSTLNIINKNKKLIELMIKLEKNGKLDKATASSLMTLKHDVDPKAIDPLRNRFRNPENKSKHSEKHCIELKCKNDEEYENMAQGFLNKKNDHDVIYHDKNGDIMKWNSQTDEYLVMNKYGNFISYYKLNCKLETDKLLYLVLPKDAKKGMCNE